QGRVTAVAFDPKGRYLTTAGEDGKVQVWQVDGWKPYQSLSAGPKVNALAWSSDGKWLLAGCDDGKTRTWSAADAKKPNAKKKLDPDGKWEDAKVADTKQGPITRVSAQAE